MSFLAALSGITATNFAVQGMSALAAVLLARLLGPEGRGDLAIVLLWPGILAHLGLLGTHVTLARRSALSSEECSSLHQFGRRLSTLLGLLAFAFAVVSLPYLLPYEKSHLVWIAQIAAIAIPASMWNIVQMQIELGGQKFQNYNVCRLFFGPIYIISSIAIWWIYGATAATIAVGFVLATILSAFIPYVLLTRARDQTAQDDLPRIGSFRLIRQSLPFGTIVGIQALASRLDIVWLSRLVDADALGIYVVAMSVAMLHSGIGNALGSFFFTRTARTEGRPESNEWIAKRSRQAITLYVFLCFLMIIVLPTLLPVLFGVAFNASSTLLPVLILATSITALAEIFEEILKGCGVSRPVVIARVSTMLTLSIGAVVFVTAHGIRAMVYAVLLGAIAHFVLLLNSVRQRFSLSVRDLLLCGTTDVREMAQLVRSVLSPRL